MERDCPQFGKCHGCAAWCDRCGDVGETCDAAVCYRHRCRVCNVLLSFGEHEMASEVLRGYPAECFRCYVACEVAGDIAHGCDETAKLEFASNTIAPFVEIDQKRRARLEAEGRAA